MRITSTGSCLKQLYDGHLSAIPSSAWIVFICLNAAVSWIAIHQGCSVGHFLKQTFHQVGVINERQCLQGTIEAFVTLPCFTSLLALNSCPCFPNMTMKPELLISLLQAALEIICAEWLHVWHDMTTHVARMNETIDSNTTFEDLGILLACRLACKSPRLAKVIILSTYFLIALALTCIITQLNFTEWPIECLVQAEKKSRILYNLYWRKDPNGKAGVYRTLNNFWK